MFEQVDRLPFNFDPAGVSKFIVNNPFLEKLLQEAAESIEVYFPASSINLEVVPDYVDREDTQLILSISPGLPPKEAIKRFDRFNRNWWFNSLKKGQNKLAITLDYI